jgi:erythromycin esterase-like protein
MVAAGCLWNCASPTSSPRPSAARDSALMAAVEAMCGAQVVFLGEEPSHGGGRTTQVKTDIVRDLVNACGFTHVAFESQIYDFIDLQERYAAGTATNEALYDAIGGLWSRNAEIDPLVDLLHEGALSGRLTISGFDINFVGATAYYSQTSFAERLGSVLPAARQEACIEAITRLAGWKFDREHPKNNAFDTAVLECAKEVEAIASVAVDRDPVQYRLAKSFRSFLEFSRTGSGNERDRMMYENLEWSIRRLPRTAKTVVWTATSHGMRQSRNGFESMASHAVRNLNPDIRSVAIIGASGAYISGNDVVELTAADEESLEGKFVPPEGVESAYVDHASLTRIGSIRSRILGYAGYVDAQWHDLFDGVLILATEAPPVRVRPATPLQATAE